MLFTIAPQRLMWRALLCACTSLLVLPSVVMAQGAPTILPGAADASRLHNENAPKSPLPAVSSPISRIENAPLIQAPKDSEKVHFVLQAVSLEGAGKPLSKEREEELRSLFATRIGKKVSLSAIYQMANAITLDYRRRGFLLSYAYIPDQKIVSGKAIIKVVEGYISNVELPENMPDSALVRRYAARLCAENPITQSTLESTLLRINDIPGAHYRAILSREKKAPAGASKITLFPADNPSRTQIGIDNLGSRYLGPMQASASHSDSFIPGHQTTLSLLSSIPTNELAYGTLSHYAVIAPDISVEGTAAITRSKAGYQLESLEIEGDSQELRLDLGYQLVRLRAENLLLKAGLVARSSNSNFFSNTPLTRDDIRVVRGEGIYSKSDRLGGLNSVSIGLAAGISGFGSSKRGDENLSRAEARPDFTKVELSISRLQNVSPDWTAYAALNGQVASSPLYASEEFGVGGMAFGRAFDTSEIIGDDGIAALFEMRYKGLRAWEEANLEPFLYYDFGWVHNRDAGQAKKESLTSVGGGVRFVTYAGTSGLLALGVPLTHEVSSPLYGVNPNGPRLIFQLTQSLDELAKN